HHCTSPVFLENQLPCRACKQSRFKPFVLEVRILWELRAYFLEVRILKGLGEKTQRRKGCGAEAPHLQRRAEEVQREGKSGEGEGGWLNCPSRLRVNDESMDKGSMWIYYCQGLLF